MVSSWAVVSSVFEAAAFFWSFFISWSMKASTSAAVAAADSGPSLLGDVMMSNYIEADLFNNSADRVGAAIYHANYQ